MLTNNPKINILRVENRVEKGGHGVPRDKIKSRYYRSLKMLPLLVELSDICHVYDNSENNRCFFRIFKKKTASTSAGKIASGKKEKISSLTGISADLLQQPPVSKHELEIASIIKYSGGMQQYS